MKTFSLVLTLFLGQIVPNMGEKPIVVDNSALRGDWVAKTAMITAYSEIDSCHYEECKMASGKSAYVGAIACPRDMELGTEVLIDGKSYVCEDRYNSDLSYRFDVFTGYGKEAHEEALEFGVKELSVIIKQ